MKIVWLSLIPFWLFAETYYAKVEPLETYAIKAAAAGKVVSVNQKLEGKVAKNDVIVHLDDNLNRLDLNNYQETLAITVERIKALEEILKVREENYSKIKDLKTKSRVEKDNEYVTLISARTSLLSAKEQAMSIDSQIDQVKDTIANKTIRAKELYIYKIHVKEGNYVSIGTALFDAMDISKAKLTVYLSKEDVENLDQKEIWLNDEKSGAQFTKISKVADSTHISSYEAEMLIPAPKLFSKLVKIELKDKNKKESVHVE